MFAQTQEQLRRVRESMVSIEKNLAYARKHMPTAAVIKQFEFELRSLKAGEELLLNRLKFLEREAESDW